MKSRAAFFDLDGTLLKKPSSELRFLHFLWKNGYLGPRQILSGLLFYPLWFLRLGFDVGRKNKAFMTGLDHGGLCAIAQIWVEENISHFLYSAICSQVEHCRNSGYTLVLLTGAPDFLAEPIAAKLGMDECIATRFVLKNHCMTPLPPLQHPLGKEKLTLAKSWCDHHYTELQYCTAYGDSHQDYHLLDAVGLPVAVNPDRRMVRLAVTRKWQVLKAA